MPRVYLPYLEILRKRIPASPEQIKTAGFDGIECHLIGGLRSPRRIAAVCKEAAGLGLGVNLHQGWSWKTGQPNFYNLVLRAVGALVPVGAPLGEQIPDSGIPAVVYGSLVGEPGRPSYRYQTVSEYTAGGKYAMTFSQFLETVKAENLPVVFDTEHCLVWSQGVHGVEGLAGLSRAAIGDLIASLWQELRPYAVEIHLCDFDPRLGRSRGRNLFPGQGIFPLSDFCAMTRESGWDGVVTPEVAPQHLRGAREVFRLREKLREFF